MKLERKMWFFSNPSNTHKFTGSYKTLVNYDMVFFKSSTLWYFLLAASYGQMWCFKSHFGWLHIKIKDLSKKNKILDPTHLSNFWCQTLHARDEASLLCHGSIRQPSRSEIHPHHKIRPSSGLPFPLLITINVICYKT